MGAYWIVDPDQNAVDVWRFGARAGGGARAEPGAGGRDGRPGPARERQERRPPAAARLAGIAAGLGTAAPRTPPGPPLPLGPGPLILLVLQTRPGPLIPR